MADIEASASLDISESLQAVDELSSHLQDSLSTVIAAFGDDMTSSLSTALGDVPPLSIEADTSAVPAAITDAVDSVAPTVPVAADTTEAQSALETVVHEAESTHATIEVDADTSNAQTAVDDLGSSAADAAGQLTKGGDAASSFGLHAGVLAGVSELATGQLSGMGSTIRGVGLGSSEAAIGIGGLALGVGVLFNKGLDATSMLQRFHTIVGESADQVLNLRVGTLNEDLDKLAIKLGTDDEALRNASASLFQFAINSGAGRQSAATFTNQVDALAARAVALNPALGSVADVAEAMAARLARGGRFAASFGLSLTPAEINARALGNTGKATAAELTIFEKSSAAAEIAVAKYGSTLGTTVAEGAKNAEIRQRSLKEQIDNILEAAGKPLVSPILQTFKDSQPAVEALASALGDLAVNSLPLVQGGLEAAVPVAQLLSETIKTLTSVTGDLGVTSIVAGAAIGAAFGGGPGAAVGAAAGAVPILSNALIDYLEILDVGIHRGIDFDKEQQDITDGVKALANATDAELIPAFRALGRQTDDFGVQYTNLQRTNTAFLDVAKQNPEVAQRIIDKFKDAGENTAAFERILAKQLATQRDTRAEQQTAAAALQSFGAAYQTPQEAVTAYIKSLEEQERLLQQTENTLLGLPGAQLNYANAVDQQRKAQDDYNTAVAQYGVDSDQAREAQLRLNDANLNTGRSALALDKANRDYSEFLRTATVPQLESEISRLQGIIQTSPEAAAALQPQIDQLTAQRDLLVFLGTLHPEPTVTVDVDRAELDRLFHDLFALPSTSFDAISRLFNPQPTAEGGIFSTPQVRSIAEVGPEAVIPLDDPVRARELLIASGLAGIVAQPATVYAPSASGCGAGGATTIDQSIHTVVHAEGQEDPTRIGIAVARRQRYAQFERSNQ